MEKDLVELEKVIKSLEESFSIMEVATQIVQDSSISLEKFDIFNRVIDDVEKLESYQKIYVDQVSAYLPYINRHLSDLLLDNNKEPKREISKEEFGKIKSYHKELELLLSKIREYNNYSNFDVYIEKLKKIYGNFIKLNSDEFLKSELENEKSLNSYIRLIIEYNNLLRQLVDLRKDMDLQNFINLKLDLDITLNLYEYNLKDIFKEIVKSNSDLFEGFLRKYNKDIEMGNYDSLLKSKTLNKFIEDDLVIKRLKNNLKSINNNFLKVIEEAKVNKEKNNQNEELIEPVINLHNKYEDDLESESINFNLNDNDKKMLYYLERFSTLTSRLKDKKELPKNELALYTKLKEEINNLRINKSEFNVFKSIKLKIYFIAVERQYKLNKDNRYNYMVKKIDKKNKAL